MCCPLRRVVIKVIAGDFNTLTSWSWQTFVFAGRAMTLADMLKILTGTRAVSPGFSHETILEQTPTFVPVLLSEGSVMADPTLHAFCTKQLTSLTSIGCKINLVVNFTKPTWLLESDEKADCHASDISSFSDTWGVNRWIILVHKIIGTFLLYSVVGTTSNKVSTLASEKGSFTVASMPSVQGRVRPSATLTSKSISSKL